jgi:hypothetical protein
MNYSAFPRRAGAALTILAVAAIAACSSSAPPSGLGTQQLSVSGDTVVGTGQLAELQSRRAAWVARGLNDYRVELRISCFCGSTITRPVLLEVRGGAVSKVLDLETSREVADKAPYPTITQLFDRAIEMRTNNGHVSVAYDRIVGFPARLEIGTIANDAGILYYLDALTSLGS